MPRQAPAARPATPPHSIMIFTNVDAARRDSNGNLLDQVAADAKLAAEVQKRYDREAAEELKAKEAQFEESKQLK